MAIILCPECSSKISDLAKSCPHCGYPLDLSEAHKAIADPIEVLAEKPFFKAENEDEDVEDEDDEEERKKKSNGNSPHEPDCDCQQCNYYRREASKPTGLETAGKALNWIGNRLLGLIFIVLGILLAYFQIGGPYVFCGICFVGLMILFFA
jgi:hypothetical protein